jgi:hypothetical protein
MKLEGVVTKSRNHYNPLKDAILDVINQEEGERGELLIDERTLPEPGFSLTLKLKPVAESPDI